MRCLRKAKQSIEISYCWHRQGGGGSFFRSFRYGASFPPRPLFSRYFPQNFSLLVCFVVHIKAQRVWQIATNSYYDNY